MNLVCNTVPFVGVAVHTPAEGGESTTKKLESNAKLSPRPFFPASGWFDNTSLSPYLPAGTYRASNRRRVLPDSCRYDALIGSELALMSHHDLQLGTVHPSDSTMETSYINTRWGETSATGGGIETTGRDAVATSTNAFAMLLEPSALRVTITSKV
jgi:hypothetical protein